MSHYSTVEAVIAYSGAREETLGAFSEPELEGIIAGYLEQATSFINADRNRNYAVEGDVPAGIHNIAMRIAANMIRRAEQQRTGSVVEINDRDLRVSDASVFDTGIKEDLAKFPRKPRFSISITPGSDLDWDS